MPSSYPPSHPKLILFHSIPPHPQTSTHTIKKPFHKPVMLIFLNHALACSKSLPTQEILMYHQSKVRGNTSWIQVLDASNSACPGIVIISTTPPLLLLLLLCRSASLPTPVLPLARSTQRYLLVTVALLVLKQPQLLV